MRIEDIQTLGLLAMVTKDASLVIEHQERAGQSQLCSNKEVEIPSKENPATLNFFDFAKTCTCRVPSLDNPYSHMCTKEKKVKVGKTELYAHFDILNFNNKRLSNNKIQKHTSNKRLFVQKNITEIRHECWDFKCEVYKDARFKVYEAQLAKAGITIMDKENGGDDLFIKVSLPEGWKIERTDHHMWSKLLDEKDRERASIFYKAAFYDRDAFLSFRRRFSVSGELPDYDEKAFEPQPENIIVGYRKEKVVNRDKLNDFRTRYGSVFQENDRIYTTYSNHWDGEFTIDVENEISEIVDVPIYEKNPKWSRYQSYEKYSQPFHMEVSDCDGTVLFKSNSIKTDFSYTPDNHRKFFDHRDECKKKANNQCTNWLNENYPGWENEFAYWN